MQNNTNDSQSMQVKATIEEFGLNRNQNFKEFIFVLLASDFPGKMCEKKKKITSAQSRDEPPRRREDLERERKREASGFAQLIGGGAWENVKNCEIEERRPRH